ncbi:hypothetical protein BJ546DRAFT_61148 [Cryomyces antarcticus]
MIHALYCVVLYCIVLYCGCFGHRPLIRSEENSWRSPCSSSSLGLPVQSSSSDILDRSQRAAAVLSRSEARVTIRIHLLLGFWQVAPTATQRNRIDGFGESLLAAVVHEHDVAAFGGEARRVNGRHCGVPVAERMADLTAVLLDPSGRLREVGGMGGKGIGLRIHTAGVEHCFLAYEGQSVGSVSVVIGERVESQYVQQIEMGDD